MDKSRRDFVGFMGYASIVGMAMLNGLSLQAKDVHEISFAPVEDIGTYHDIDAFDPDGWL